VDIKDSITKVGDSGNKTLITIGTALFVALLSGIFGFIMHGLK
jgi:hypothetical protein